MTERCPECGVQWKDEQTCRDDFDQMLYWESEDAARWAVHHLMVLCYHLQHPSLYSAEGLVAARQLLADFIESGLSPEAVRRGRGSGRSRPGRAIKAHTSGRSSGR